LQIAPHAPSFLNLAPELAENGCAMPPCDDCAPDLISPRTRLHNELGRLIAILASTDDDGERTDLVDHAYDVIAVLERLDGATHVAHPRGLRLVRADEAA
jgi:hypothetical protein